MMSLKIYNDKIQIYKNLKVIYNVIIILLPVVNTIISYAQYSISGITLLIRSI